MQFGARASETKEYEALLLHYLHICNRAAERYKHSFPYTEIWDAIFPAEHTSSPANITVYDDRPKYCCQLQLTNDRQIHLLFQNIPASEKYAWPLSYLFLKRVKDNPEHYLNRPAMLDWGWMQLIE